MADPYTLKEFDDTVKGPGLFGLHLTRIRATLERLEALASDREQIQKTLHEAIDERNAAIREREEAKSALMRIQGIGADGLMDGLDYGDYLAAVKARDEARAEVERLRAVLYDVAAFLGVPPEERGLPEVVAKAAEETGDEMDSLREQAARAETRWYSVAGVPSEMQDAARDVAKRQREACASEARFYAGLGLDGEKVEEKVRATPLVTDPKP